MATSSDSREDIRFYLSRRLAFINSQIDQLHKEVTVVNKLLQEQHIESIDVTKSLSHGLLPTTPSPQQPRRSTLSSRSVGVPARSPERPVVPNTTYQSSTAVEPTYLHPRVYLPEELAPHALRPPLTSAKSSGDLRGDPARQHHPAFRNVEKQSVFGRFRSLSKT